MKKHFKTIPAERVPSADRICPWEAEAAAYVDQALTGAETSAFEQHLQECEHCRHCVESFEQVADELRAFAPQAPCRDLIPGILQRIPDAAWSRADTVADERAWGWFPARLWQAAAVFLALLAGVGLWGVSRPPHATEPVAAARTEAVQDALRWLASVQEPNGAWDPQPWNGRPVYEVGLTGMALLTFLRHEEAEPAFAEHAIERGVTYLLGRQQPDGGLGPAATGRMYNHGMAAVALLEAYRQGRAPNAEDALRRALAFIREQQHEAGGWGYHPHPMSRPNTSVSVWQMEALALGMGLDPNAVAPGLKRGLHWLETMANEQGQFGYQEPGGPGAHAALSAMGAYGLFQAAGQDSKDSARQRAMAQRALNRVADQAESEADELDYYQSYFVASALKASSESGHRQLLARLRSRLQAERNIQKAYAGTWDPTDRWGAVGGRLYATTMAALTLE